MDNKNSTKVMGYLDGGDVCRSRKDQREATCRKIPLHLVDDLLRLPLDPPLSLLPLLSNKFSRPRKGEIVCVLIFPHIGLIDLSLMAGLTGFFNREGRPVGGTNYRSFPLSPLLPPQQ